MTINERAEKAAELKLTGACNCCQAVTKVFADTVNVDEATLQKMSAGFAAGMGCMEATCGALVGANMILGLRTNGEGTVRQSRELLANFREKCGAVTCKDLKGVGTGKVLCECDNCVRNAVKALGEILGE
ncbi:C_GCAxxG_C_C family protein [Treponema ruminis]|uniref:C_GCAxxG_C_C family probable redox protein n=1 Tax=Treponema ruminis TaxID=744515 RepID=A0A7W8LL72_9SPIR|nr:C-GCAxxG-C-C family protein [Treponema ruminis]MBB5225124.1 C_GCAxxG_C_C family probable redox protein [Treponema ruminis]QSI01045.1 C_GCAxxG_C_C family protein [Treponema ruminis]